MSNTCYPAGREFHVETNFQKLARRPGGVARDQAIKNAEANIETLKPGFENWLDVEMDGLLAATAGAELRNPKDQSWIDVADRSSQRLADVAGTMDYPLMSFVANNLCLIFDAIKNGAEFHSEVIACHVKALLLSRQQQYRKAQPDDFPELSDGLRRILDSPRLQPQMEADAPADRERLPVESPAPHQRQP